MDSMEALARRLPADADRICRLFWRDLEFRTVCEDYRDALSVLAKLEAEPCSDAARVEEYRQLAEELLGEAALLLRKA